MVDTRNNSKNYIPTILSVTGIFSAVTIFAYTFGSIYIYRYYGFFGIPRGAMDFTIQDYMGHSLFPILLAFQIGIWVELLRYNIKNNYFFGFNLTRIDEIGKDLEARGVKSYPSFIKAIYKDNPHVTIMNIIMSLGAITFAIVWLSFTLFWYVNNTPTAGTTVVVIFSFSIGVIFFFATQVMKFAFSEVYKDFSLAQFISSIAAIAIFFIICIGIMAEMQANYDTTKLTRAVIVTQTELPTEIRSFEDDRHTSKILRIITINNNRLYAYLDEECNADNNTKSFSVYAIDYSSIDYTKYIIGETED